jgi:2-dehydropantoate 2-reductase
VTLLGRPWHLDAVHERGLWIDGIWGEHYADGFQLANGPADLRGTYDLVLVCVKSFDTEAIAAEITPVLGADGIAISIQNGLSNVERLSAALGAERVLGGRILMGATIPEPGHVTITVHAAPFAFGPLREGDAKESMPAARRWAEAFREAGIACELVDTVLPHLWSKAFYNCALNSLGAFLGVHYGALGEDEDLRAIMDGVIDEAYAVAAARGVQLPWRSAAEYRELFYSQLLPATYVHRNSMLQDLERGHRVEIDAVNGQVWAYGRELEMPTPFNEMLTRLIHWRERQALNHAGSAPAG